jgi:hypothetical protein
MGTEISGAYLSQDASENATIEKVYIDKYKYNTYSSSRSSLYQCYSGNNPSLNNFFTITDFHTHPINGYNRESIENPSGADKSFRDSHKNQFWTFLILTQQEYHPDNAQKIDYTNY